MRNLLTLAAMFAVIWMPLASRAAVVINEFQYDDSGTDDMEFVELYNSGAAAVDISGWVLQGSDTVAPPGDNNPDFTIPAATMLAPGGYYVIGNALVPNVNQVVASNAFENDNDAIQLLDASGAVLDTVIYELNKGPVAVSPAEGGIWGNSTFSHPGGAGTLSGALGRYLDGRDTDVNGRDFGMRLATPGAINQGAGLTALYLAPDVTGNATGSDLPGYAFSFVGARVIEPTIVDGNNPNSIPNPPSGNKAIVGWDPSGGGNGLNQAETMVGAMAYDIFAYLDTNDLPVSTNASGVAFRGSEVTQFGLGSSDSFTNLSDVSGAIGIGTGVSANGATGVLWHYEKAGLVPGGGPASEMLYLIDAGPGGDSNVNGTLDWTVLATIDLTNATSDWHRLTISVDPTGAGTASFDNQVFQFQTARDQAGSFYAGYRENTQDAAVGVPNYVRPATWAAVPEPGSMVLAGLALVGLVGFARRK